MTNHKRPEPLEDPMYIGGTQSEDENESSSRWLFLLVIPFILIIVFILMSIGK